MVSVNSETAISSPEDFRALERTRLKSLVDRDIVLAQQLHSPEFHLVTPGGVSRSRESYLSAVMAGDIRYLKWEPRDIAVRLHTGVALLRYQADLEMLSKSGEVASFTCWHTDSYELQDGTWQVVFSHATRIV